MSDGPFVEQGHLGGYRQGGDDATYYPELWDWIVREENVRTILDVGCGEGHSLEYFTHLVGRGNAIGTEGVPQDEGNGRLIVHHDYTTGPDDHPWIVEAEWDLIWCCEFVEHVEERYVDNFLATFALGKIVLMTHAEPGQGGYHHVNCQPDTYWIDKLAGIGFYYDHTLALKCHAMASRNLSPWNHFVRSGLAFRRSHR